MLRLLIDTSVWIDMAEMQDGQRWIVPLRFLQHQKKLELLVPSLVIDEFDRNRPRREDALSKPVVDKIRQLRRDLHDFAGDRAEWGLLDELQQHVPLVNTTAPQNFREIAELLRAGTALVPTEREYANVVQRGLTKKAPFCSDKKQSVADAVLIELYATQVQQRNSDDVYCFVTSNSSDFSLPNGDRRQPHPDIAELFSDPHSLYGYRVEGLDEILTSHLGDAFREEQDEVDALAGFDEPRTLAEIVEAEQEFFDRVWFVRHVVHSNSEDVSVPGLEAKYGPDQLWEPIGDGHDQAWQYGFISGKLSALRWVLGSEWDFLDT